MTYAELVEFGSQWGLTPADPEWGDFVFANLSEEELERLIAEHN